MLDLTKSKILITGVGAQLAVYFMRLVEQKGLRVRAFSRQELDISNYKELSECLSSESPDIVLNFASYNLIDQAEDDPDQAMKINALAVEQMAHICRQENIFLVHFSSAHVFNGRNNTLYHETDAVDPVNVYGKSKLKGEEAIQSTLKNFLLLRLSWAFGHGKNCFFTKVRSWAAMNPILKISSDEVSIPMYSQDVIEMTVLALEKQLTGLYHLTSNGTCSRAEYVKRFIEEMGMSNQVEPVPAQFFKLKAQRPSYSCLSNHKLTRDLNKPMPHWEDGVKRFTINLKQNKF